MNLREAAEIFRKLEGCENRVVSECMELDGAECEKCPFFVTSEQEEEAWKLAAETMEACAKFMEDLGR